MKNTLKIKKEVNEFRNCIIVKTTKKQQKANSVAYIEKSCVTFAMVYRHIVRFRTAFDGNGLAVFSQTKQFASDFNIHD